MSILEFFIAIIRFILQLIGRLRHNSEPRYNLLLNPELALSETSTVPHKFTPRYWSADSSTSVSTYRVAVDRKTFQDVKRVVTATWLSQFVGHGRDRLGLAGYSYIQVVKVERIQNLKLFSEYARRRQMLRRKARTGACFQILDVENVMTWNSIDDKSVLAVDTFPEVNETYLFHGTKKDNVGSIAERGLHLGSDTSMFGKGVYAAESSTKADQYVDPTHNRDIKSEKQMFLIRACLGRPFYANSARKFVGRPCLGGCKDRCWCEEKNVCDSVIASGYWNFREFVVFESCQVYPEYLITYKRI